MQIMIITLLIVSIVGLFLSLYSIDRLIVEILKPMYEMIEDLKKEIEKLKRGR